MPAPHLSPDLTPATPLAGSVLRVLAGAPLDAAATAAGVDPDDLADAVDAYHAAGLAALEHHTDGRWYQVRATFPDWDTAETTAARTLGPHLDQLTAAGAIDGWWFLRKQPCWRLRFIRPQPAAVNRTLDQLTAAGAILSWWPTVYEPETAAFGGPAGIQAVHDLFCADSRGVLDYLRQPRPGLGRRELSLLLLGGLLRGADLDWFERGDVFARVAQLRPAPGAAEPRIPLLVTDVRGLLVAPAEASDALLAPGGAVAFAAPWHTAHQAAGHRLASAAASGTLHRGLRAVLSHIVIFHWNRLGLSTRTQAILARAASDAFLPGS
jgi:thiopeptide-type bacteriocin biosynthesis protein